MKTWFIKLGKVWAIIRQDGLIRGGRRVWTIFTALFQSIGTGQILLISGGMADSARYRTKHVAEELSFHGLPAAATYQDHPKLLLAVEQFQIFILHRTLLTPKLAQFIERAKALKKTIIFETDDLVYDPAFLIHMDYWQKMNVLERKLYEHGVGGEVLMDPYVEVATTTTNFLAEKLQAKGKQVFVVPNKLSKQDVAWAEQALHNQQSAISNQQIVRIGYLSGTPSHDRDFATITGALVKLFETYPEMRLVLTGPLDTESELNQYNDRIERIPFVPRKELFGNIASLDINVAPLEIGNPFCEAKSELKFFEAGIVKVPTIAAATETFRDAITDGVDGFVADTTEAWVDKIGLLIKNKDLRAEMGNRARQTALERYTTVNAKNEKYYQYLRSRISSVM